MTSCSRFSSVGAAKPWTVNVNQHIALDTGLLEYACLENEKDVPHLVGKSAAGPKPRSREPKTMKRVLEPELMDDEQQSIAYAKADFSTSNQFFVDSVARAFPDHLHSVVDMGCGPGDVEVRLARAAPDVRITAVDGSAPMIVLARDAVRAAGLDGRVTVVQGFIPGVPLREHGYDAILSKDFLHHLPDPSVLWREVVRLGRAGAAVAVMDLIRPETPEDARRIVDTVAAGEDPLLVEDFYNSLCAAFTIDELREQLATAGLTFDVAKVSDRHRLVKGLLP